MQSAVTAPALSKRRIRLNVWLSKTTTERSSSATASSPVLREKAARSGSEGSVTSRVSVRSIRSQKCTVPSRLTETTIYA